MNHRYLLLLVTGLCCASCGKEDAGQPPSFDPQPFITLQRVYPDTVRQFLDTLWFEVRYTDGDGDLGDYDADTLSLWLTDHRFPLTMRYHIPPQAPAGAVIPITGTLVVALTNVILKDAYASSETALFSVKLKDRSAHWSNEVFSPPIKIIP